MLSPEYFYTWLRDMYGYPRTNNILMIPKYNGAKNHDDFVPALTGEIKHQFTHVYNFGKKSVFDRCIVYDQEVLTSHFTDTYRNLILETQKIPEHTVDLPPAQLIAIWTKTTGIPIFCHSEKNSPEIRDLENYLFVSCYYWYHAIIARDWYRLELYNPLLQPKNRGRAPYRFLLYARGKDGSRSYRQTLLNQLCSIREKILQNWDDTVTITSDHSAIITPEHGEMSSIHVVAETWFETEKIHLTEKIFKPIVMSQPFILCGPPGSLSYVRDYGFKTFNDVWDESYDQELNHSVRLAKIVNLIKDLASLSDREIESIYEKILGIIEHNRRWFYSDEFRARIMKELFDNFDTALQRQIELKHQYPGGQFCLLANDVIRKTNMLPINSHTCLKEYFQLVDQNYGAQILARYPRLRDFL